MRHAPLLLLVAIGCRTTAAERPAPTSGITAQLAADTLRRDARAGAAATTSLLGTPRYPPKLDSATRARLESDLQRAEADVRARPDDPDALIWVGRRQAYLGRYNIPIGSLQSNVWYHLALAHYLKGDWNSAARASRAGIGVSSNPDRLVSQTHWLYMALRRAGRDDEARAALAPIRDDFAIILNSNQWASFGYIAAEADLARLRRAR